VLLYAAVTRGACLDDIPFRPLRLRTVLQIILFAVLLIPVMTWINMFSLLFSENYVSQELQSASNETFWKNMVFVAVIPAILEEYAVRGVLFHGYRKAGILKGAIVSGLLFGLMHLNFNQFCYAAVLGIIFALLVEATGSIFSSMIAHFIINLNSVILVAVSSDVTSDLQAESEAVISRSELIQAWTVYTVIAVLFGVLAYGVFVWIMKSSGRTEHMYEVLKDRKKSEPGVDSDSRDAWTSDDDDMEVGEPGMTSRKSADQAASRKHPVRLVTPTLVIAVAACVLYMAAIEWIL
jgi:membrane protease YdiL (CAAX protease family)